MAEATEKLASSIPLYFPERVLNDSTPRGSGPGARCGKCMMAREDGKCFGVYLDEDEKKPLNKRRSPVSLKKGVCGLYTPGKPHKVEDGDPMPTVPRSSAGYYEGEGVPTHCGNCRNYRPHKEEVGECVKVEGIGGEVEKYGCCNSWKLKNPKRYGGSPYA